MRARQKADSSHSRSPSLPLHAAAIALLLAATATHAEQALPLNDVHIHYSHDAWEQLPPAQAIAALRDAGLQRAFVSSSSDEGTQKLYALALDFIVPVRRPYRRRGEISTWFRDDGELILRPLGLNEDDSAALVAFLETLSGPLLDATPDEPLPCP